MSKPTPKTVVPIVAVESVDEIRRFYVDTLGFDHVRGVVGKDGQLDFCTVAKDGARIMFARPREGAPAPRLRPRSSPLGYTLRSRTSSTTSGSSAKRRA